MKKFIIGAILLFVGLSIVSPLEELLLLAPLSAATGLPLVGIFTLIAIVCLILSVWFLGRSFVLNKIKPHWKMILITFVVLTIYFSGILNGVITL